ncbi:glycosylphosphatidylinositol anchor attachment related protein [Cyclospora cayetanensis]|uniref:Glycosylphosphatidylinositol anchor attachment related protein n=1 Tax=Cyclospora cayetanensis TaxID=88456 RepID=A0A1D3D5Z3_9EIME|nr:glycosylphosphatidylinositol anchor attachment related protein [Cyclospora cayetanensis]
MPFMVLQKAALWLYAALPLYVVLLVLAVYAARRIRQTQLEAHEHTSQIEDPGCLFSPPGTRELFAAAVAAAGQTSPQGAAAAVPSTTDDGDTDADMLRQQQEQALEQPQRQEALQMIADQLLDFWLPPVAPPALWICIRTGCRLLLVIILLALVTLSLCG